MKIACLLLYFISNVGFAESPRRELIEESKDLNVQKIKRLKVKDISDLKNLTPFESVSVIQKRYLQKTFRGELNVSLSSIINNKFFYVAGASGHLGFFVRDAHSLGIESYAMGLAEKLVSSDLIKPPNRILPYSFVVSQLYSGVYYKWSPVFGKFAILDRDVVYFDMFFTIGMGMTKLRVA